MNEIPSSKGIERCASGRKEQVSKDTPDEDKSRRVLSRALEQLRDLHEKTIKYTCHVMSSINISATTTTATRMASKKDI